MLPRLTDGSQAKPLILIWESSLLMGINPSAISPPKNALTLSFQQIPNDPLARRLKPIWTDPKWTTKLDIAR